jgi:hypothetical protein
MRFQLGHDPASEAIRDYFWRAKEPKGRKLTPIPDFVATAIPNAAELGRTPTGVANGSGASPEQRAAVIGIIRRAFER